MESVIWDFITPLDKDELFIIPSNMFEVKKNTISTVRNTVL